VTEPCYVGPLIGVGSVCADPDGYLFWDTDRPTAAGHAVIAAAASALVLEPRMRGVLATGLAGIAFSLRRGRMADEQLPYAAEAPVCCTIGSAARSVLPIGVELQMPYTVEDSFSVAERAAALGCALPEGLAILPANFATAANPEEFLYDPAGATVRTLFRTNQIPLQDLLPPGTPRRQVSYKSAEWVGPTLFVGYALLSDNGNFLNIALGVVANYLTEFFRGAGKAPTIRLDFIVEKTPSREYKHLKFEGPPEAIPALMGAVQAIRDE